MIHQSVTLYGGTGMMLLAGALNALELLLALFLSDPKVTAPPAEETAQETGDGSGGGSAADDEIVAPVVSADEAAGGLKPSQAAQVWSAMQLDQVWRPMVFICVFALAPGNGSAKSTPCIPSP